MALASTGVDWMLGLEKVKGDFWVGGLGDHLHRQHIEKGEAWRTRQ